MVETRRIVARRADVANDGDEPLLELARRKVAVEGGSLRKVLRDLREERRARARELALAEAPKAEQQPDGSYTRVSRDVRWPFGVDQEGRIVAPFGLSECGTPRVGDPTKRVAGPKKGELAARQDAREIIMSKLKRLGCDPIEIIAEIAMDSEEKSEVRLRAAAELATMVYPRLRGVEMNQRSEKTVFVIGVPSEQPKNADAWLAGAEGPRRIAEAVKDAGEIIDVEAVPVETKSE